MEGVDTFMTFRRMRPTPESCRELRIREIRIQEVLGSIPRDRR